ncbi:MAG: VOC family protein [Anaerolineales bacterium]|nr:VOC family protein [Anaerolineales bacterium]
MKLEHIAFNVADPVAVARWYTEHMRLTIIRNYGPPLHAHFLASAPGQPMIEFYHNPADPVPDYAALHPVRHHIAFVVDDIAAERARLLAAGCTPFDEPTTNAAGDTLVFLRDPWGLALQLVKRAVALM